MKRSTSLLLTLILAACGTQRADKSAETSAVAAAPSDSNDATTPVASPLALFTCSLMFSDANGHRLQRGLIGQLSTADGEMPRLQFDDNAGYYSVSVMSVNYMRLLSLSIRLPHQNIEDHLTVDLPAPSDRIFEKSYEGDFGTRRTWTPPGTDVDFQSTKLDVICMYSGGFSAPSADASTDNTVRKIEGTDASLLYDAFAAANLVKDLSAVNASNRYSVESIACSFNISSGARRCTLTQTGLPAVTIAGEPAQAVIDVLARAGAPKLFQFEGGRYEATNTHCLESSLTDATVHTCTLKVAN